jgi:hypothetical protein
MSKALWRNATAQTTRLKILPFCCRLATVEFRFLGYHTLGVTQLRYFAFQSRILACGSMVLADLSMCGFSAFKAAF